MSSDVHDAIDERLARLATDTASLRPRGGFDDRVMQAVAASRSPFADGLFRAARGFVPAALLAAVLAVGWAVQTGHDADRALASGFDTMVIE